jgi:hypothetical protein
MDRTIALSAGLALVALAATAQARDEFPGLIAEQLHAPHDPPCGVCHEGGKTGSAATVFTPFAWAMRAHGLADSASSVQTAAQGVKDDAVDSDGDGTPDWRELVDGTDPNAPGTAMYTQDPQLGCQMVNGSPGPSAAGWLAALLAVMLRRRPR